MLWRLFSDIKNENQTYTMKYMEEKDRIDENLKRHLPFDDIDPEELQDGCPQEIDGSSSESENDDEVVPSLHPGIIEYEEEEDAHVGQNSSGDIIAISNLMRNVVDNEIYYSMVHQLNKRQRNLFYFITKHIQKVKHGLEPDPFHIFMTGGGGVGKSFIIKTISEYANRFLKFPNQRTDQPSIMLTASTGI